MNFLKIPFTLAFIMFLTSSCNNMFYYPDKRMLINPEKAGYKQELITFYSKDNTELKGWFFKSKTTPVKGTIIHYHGNAENISTHFLFSAWLTEMGYNLFIFDYRGYGQSKGVISREGAHQDAISAYKYAVANFYKKDQKLILFGQSLGGAILLGSFGDLKSLSPISAIIIESSFYSYQEVVRDKFSNIWLTWPFQHLAYLLFSDDYSPEGNINKISPIPLLVIHGNKDRVVPIKFGKFIFDKAKEPKEFWEVKNGGHTGAFLNKDNTYRKKLIDYLDNLPK